MIMEAAPPRLALRLMTEATRDRREDYLCIALHQPSSLLATEPLKLLRRNANANLVSSCKRTALTSLDLLSMLIYHIILQNPPILVPRHPQIRHTTVVLAARPLHHLPLSPLARINVPKCRGRHSPLHTSTEGHYSHW